MDIAAALSIVTSTPLTEASPYLQLALYVVSMFLLIVSGTRTKMELAWQKERESQKKLINELNTMARYGH